MARRAAIVPVLGDRSHWTPQDVELPFLLADPTNLVGRLKDGSSIETTVCVTRATAGRSGNALVKACEDQYPIIPCVWAPMTSSGYGTA